MQPSEAMLVFNMAMAEYDSEVPVTRKVIAAVPAGQEGYAPDPRSMNALKLAWHIVASEIWFLNSIADGEFVPEEGAGVPAEVKSAADVVAWYDTYRDGALARLKAMSGAELAEPIDFFGLLNLPGAAYLSFNLRHVVHHRGQLSAYLRPMGGKVPSIYGGSADEPMS
ncbi:MAG: DinB family protein [Acidobacteria bacterium]|nr:DinB family protein [Acidobacteriota bacterium]